MSDDYAARTAWTKALEEEYERAVSDPAQWRRVVAEQLVGAGHDLSDSMENVPPGTGADEILEPMARAAIRLAVIALLLSEVLARGPLPPRMRI